MDVVKYHEKVTFEHEQDLSASKVLIFSQSLSVSAAVIKWAARNNPITQGLLLLAQFTPFISLEIRSIQRTPQSDATRWLRSVHCQDSIKDI